VSNACRIAASRTVNATAAEVFRIVTDPNMHVKIDGSGMLQAAPDAKRVQAVGDTFDMDMDAAPLGSVTIGKYQVVNTVTKIVPDTLLEWSVGSRERGGFGHVYGWEMLPGDTGETTVTNYYDWTEVAEKRKDRFPVISEAMLEASIDNLVALVAAAPT
jgi:uncharacterized protein YndB with AHSA1/START domain